jgi:hypothetical protein
VDATRTLESKFLQNSNIDHWNDARATKDSTILLDTFEETVHGSSVLRVWPFKWSCASWGHINTAWHCLVSPAWMMYRYDYNLQQRLLRWNLSPQIWTLGTSNLTVVPMLIGVVAWLETYITCKNCSNQKARGNGSSIMYLYRPDGLKLGKMHDTTRRKGTGIS